MEDIRLVGDLVVVRPWHSDDKPALLRHGNDPEVARTMADAFPHPYGPEDADKWLEHTATDEFHNKHVAIEFEGEPVGGIGYGARTDVFRRCGQIGYWIGRAHWGKGIATEAVRLLTDHIWAATDLIRLQAPVFENNPASARVLEKAGYYLECRQPRSAFKLGEVLDTLLFVCLREDAA